MTTTHDTPLAIAEHTGIAHWLTLDGYADHVGKTRRTIMRWLADGELPGAVKHAGAWMIPADAVRTVGAELVPMSQDTTQDTAPVMTLDALPSFLTIDQAAHILGISRHAITTHRAYFDVVPFGANGTLVVPLATIKKIRG